MLTTSDSLAEGSVLGPSAYPSPKYSGLRFQGRGFNRTNLMIRLKFNMFWSMLNYVAMIRNPDEYPKCIP